MKPKQERTLIAIAVLVALFMPIKVTAVIAVLILLWCFRDSIILAALSIPDWFANVVAFFKPKRKSVPKQPNPQIIDEGDKFDVDPSIHREDREGEPR